MVPGAKEQPHPTWCQFDAPGALGGVEHYSRLLVWRPTYHSEVVVLGWLRSVRYPDGSEETPAVALQVDNPEHPGEIALSQEDLASLAEHLQSLRRALGD
jgi:hypothetical protein